MNMDQANSYSAPHESPSYRISLGELSGALADLGVMLPLVLTLIAHNGMDATATFVGIGLSYLLTALLYRLPIPVQPLKSVSALAIALGLPPAVIVGAAFWNAVFFLGMGAFKLDRWFQRLFAEPVVRGIQLGLAYLLLRSAWGLISKSPAGWNTPFSILDVEMAWNWLLSIGATLALVLFLLWRRDYASLGVFGFGLGLATFQIGLPEVSLQLKLPSLLPILPTANELWQALIWLALPQIPLSLGNSIYATADVARQYFGKRAAHITERRLMLTMGWNDALTFLLGGVPVCHGCGGLTAHVRLGARTGGAPLMLGIAFLSLGVFGGETLTKVLEYVPLPILGVLLAYVGVQHALLVRNTRLNARNSTTILLVLALTVLTNHLAVGFLSAAFVYHVWGKLEKKIP
ncbi:MAG: putative sulfate/molybdate transporter [Anaerolineales bacterium]|nr:putative sulfate/molybdate transporter [Anaerolineales bacterium]